MQYKRVLTIQDISCVGQCSITVALPILSACGQECCVLPTAVLVVGILLSFLAWWFLAVALGICLVLWVINVMGELPATENQITASAVVAVILVLAVVLGGVLANWSIGETSRGGDTINEGIEDAREAAEDGDYPYSNKTPIHTMLDTLIYIEN